MIKNLPNTFLTMWELEQIIHFQAALTSCCPFAEAIYLLSHHYSNHMLVLLEEQTCFSFFGQHIYQYIWKIISPLDPSTICQGSSINICIYICFHSNSPLAGRLCKLRCPSGWQRRQLLFFFLRIFWC